MKWTEDQKKVITLRDRNILVAAAAGAGKTATLVERILTWICQEEHPGEIDRLLVLTFTKAAAGEMRERIGRAIEDRLKEEPENMHLQRQSTLVHNAQITTIHSFCLYVVRNYFHLLSIDPGFRMGDEGELKLLKKDVLAGVLEEYFQEGRPEFHTFVEAYATGKRDEVLEKLILDLAEFSLGYPYPIRWLRECRMACQVQDEEEMEKSRWMGLLELITRQTLLSVREQLQGGISICLSAQGPYLYEETLQRDVLLLEELLACDTYETRRQALEKPTYARLTTKRMEDVSQEKKNQIKALRESMKKCLKGLREKFYMQSLAQTGEYLSGSAPATCMLLELTERYLEEFEKKKRSRNLVDYSDLEHLALKILVQDIQPDDRGGLQVIPTEAAEELADYFEEIMIDEYQDSNLLQEVLLGSVSRVRRGRPNIFMVGDVKQSIYSFRLARPELFLEKYHTYTLEDSLYQRIDLKQNFRSRQEVLESANRIFAKLMTPAVGGISYDQAAALYPGADYPANSPGQNQTEVWILETDMLEEGDRERTEKEEDRPRETGKIGEDEGGDPKGDQEREDQKRTARELEAAMIGNRIHSLLQEFQVWDGKTGAYRPLVYGDIVILLRSLNGWGDVFARVLTEQGIPAYTESRTGYFDTVEVQTLLNLLRIVDNPRQDIPLAAVMRSMMGGFTNQEMAKIRSEYGELRFFQACRAYAGRESEKAGKEGKGPGEDKELSQKLQAFYAMLDGYRQKAQYQSVHEFITYVLEDTGYGDYLAVLPGGEQRSANMAMLVERAIAFENTSYRGLFHFVRYMEQLQSYQEDLGEASVSGEGEHAVRIMSIHKSKGLEFPVVFVAGMGKGFNYQDSRSRVVLHPDLGIGVDYVDSSMRVKTPTLPKRVIQKQRELEMLGEELRVLYVALTRAREKLILTGSLSNLEKKLGNYQLLEGRGTLNYLELTGVRTYWDWILPAVWQEKPFLIRQMGPEELVFSGLQTQILEAGRQEELERLTSGDPILPQEEERLKEQLEFVYPFETEVGLQLKVSVSELKREGQVEEEEQALLLYPEPEVVPYVPRFMKEGQVLTGAARGTAYHRALQELHLEKMTHTERVKEALETLVEQGKLSREMADSIRPWDIYAFARTDLARRMTKARAEGRLYMEQPFVISMPAVEIRPEWESREPVLIQGIMDAWFYEKASHGSDSDKTEEELVILDYKTDWVREGGELLERYGRQLDYYERALVQITGKRVKEKLIYSFCLGEVVVCP
ncbi:MAG: helicase-exonuclease AddAB subunit AddA [Lachnospiraceae bacterium]|nr:helicase-exonuclease AddAB subunit AddA [Lachnospiraceae bacterium]